MIDVVMPIYQALEPECFISIISMQPIDSVNFIVLPHKSDIVEVRNELRIEVLKAGHEFSLWVDADIRFPRDGLSKLMEVMRQSEDVGVVSGIYRQRKPPHACCAWKWYKGEEGEGYIEACQTANGKLLNEDAFPIDACGAGFMLVRNTALRGVSFNREGAYSEDISFCRKVKRLDWQVYAHAGVRCGHVANTVLEV